MMAKPSNVVRFPGRDGAVVMASGSRQSLSRLLSRLDMAMVHLLDQTAEWRQRAADRRVLASMDERQLRDIGFSRIEAETEANKPFWRG